MDYVQPQFDWLIHWINEREQIRRRKEAGQPRPWTSDEILDRWRFCNVNRCDDRETRWIFANVIAQHADSPVLWFNLLIARFLNWSPTLERVGYIDAWDRDHFVAVMASIAGKAYTGAYMIPAGPAGMVKHEYLADQVFGSLWDQRENAPPPGSPCSWWDVFLRRAPSCGDFLRNQIITDLRYSHHLPKDRTADWTTFLLAGPGTKRGLNRLLGYSLERSWQGSASAQAVRDLRSTLAGVPTLSWAVPVFDDLNNLANCLCEFDKYCRVRLGEGSPRARYVEAHTPLAAIARAPC
jgi:hypothetical protein